MLTPKEWRRARGISQESMAEMLGVHVNTLRAWEDKPSEIKYSIAAKMADIFETDITNIKFLP